MPSSAVLLMDLQVDFLDTEKGRMPVSPEGAAAVIAAANAVLRADILPDAHPAIIVSRFPRSQTLANFFRNGAAVEGTDGALLDPRIPMRQSCPVFVKSRASAFSNSDLHSWLEDRSVSRLCIMGVFAEGCVRATAIEARALGYEVIVPLNAVASNAAWKLRFAVWAMRKQGVWLKETLDDHDGTHPTGLNQSPSTLPRSMERGEIP